MEVQHLVPCPKSQDYYMIEPGLELESTFACLQVHVFVKLSIIKSWLNTLKGPDTVLSARDFVSALKKCSVKRERDDCDSVWQDSSIQRTSYRGAVGTSRKSTEIFLGRKGLGQSWRNKWESAWTKKGEGALMGWILSLQNSCSMLKPKSPRPQNVTVSGDRASEEVIRLNCTL